jgi:hypothetical protein
MTACRRQGLGSKSYVSFLVQKTKPKDDMGFSTVAVGRNPYFLTNVVPKNP